MIRKLLAIWLLATVMLACLGSTNSPDPDILIQNERKFSEAVAKDGMSSGFIQFLSQDGVLYAPMAVNGIELHEANPNDSRLLMWQPIYAELSANGRMGWTTGPWEFKNASGDSQKSRFGHYVSVWKIQSDSTWKVELDIGVAHELVQLPKDKPALRVLASLERTESGHEADNLARLRQIEQEFSSDVESLGLSAAYDRWADDDIRYYRSGELPFRSYDSVLSISAPLAGRLTWELMFASISDCGSMGYTRGVGTSEENESLSKFNFVHIWRQAQQGGWKLALDINTPLPSEYDEP